MRISAINWPVVLFLLAQLSGAVWWAAGQQGQVAQLDREFERDRAQRSQQTETLKDKDEALMAWVERVKDRLEPITAKVSRLEALQEGMSRSLSRLENVFDEARKRGRGK